MRYFNCQERDAFSIYWKYFDKKWKEFLADIENKLTDYRDMSPKEKK